MIRKYSLNKFYVCAITGTVLVEETMQLPNAQPYANIVPFSNVDAAHAYVNRHKKDWLWVAIVNWLKHKTMIFKSNGEFAKAEIATELIKTFDLNIPTKALKTTCKSIIGYNDKLVGLLPAKENASHDSSVKELSEILTFCENNLQ